MGRPKGSKNKMKFDKSFKPKGRRGRPPGVKNKKRTLSDYGPQSLKVLACSKCETETVAGSEAVAVLCPKCTQSSLPKADWGYHKPKRDPNAPKRKRGRPRKNPLPPLPNGEKRKRGRPRKNPDAPVVVKKTLGWGKGWHLRKKFKAPNGKFYSFGKEVKK